MAQQLSTKHLLVDKANASMVIIVAVSAFITVFSLVAAKGLLSQRAYQARVIAAKRTALNQLKANNKAANQLVSSYKDFVASSPNMIGGDPNGTNDKDGDNAKITLDALPSKYDFPAVATSLEKILTSQNYKIGSISGIDDELKQSALSPDAPVQPVPMPFGIEVKGSFKSINDLITLFQHSIRPIQISQLSLRGKDNDLNLILKASTYYQPEKIVTITTRVVK